MGNLRCTFAEGLGYDVFLLRCFLAVGLCSWQMMLLLMFPLPMSRAINSDIAQWAKGDLGR